MRIIETQLLYEGKLKAVRETLETAEGKRFKHETVQHPGAVVVLPVLSDGGIVFIEQYRHSVRQNLLELPAGTLEEREDPAVCAQRELREEIGMGSRDLLPVGKMLPAPGFCNEVQHCFLARGLFPEKATPDEDEVITTVVMSMREVREAVMSERLVDGKSLALLMRVQLLGLL